MRAIVDDPPSLVRSLAGPLPAAPGRARLVGSVQRFYFPQSRSIGTMRARRACARVMVAHDSFIDTPAVGNGA